ncbi:unnamed protein product, partial [Musa hybrid cultivar]
MCFPSATSAYVRGCRCFMALRRFRGLRRWTSSASSGDPIAPLCKHKSFVDLSMSYSQVSLRVLGFQLRIDGGEWLADYPFVITSVSMIFPTNFFLVGHQIPQPSYSLPSLTIISPSSYSFSTALSCSVPLIFAAIKRCVCHGEGALLPSKIFPADDYLPPLSSFLSLHLLRRSAFSKPILPLSSSLIPSRGGGGCCDTAATGGERNGASFGSSTIPTATEENSSSHSNTRNPDPAPISVLSPAGAGASLPNSIQSAEVKTAVTTVDASVKYKECLRNHAAAIGGHVLDGCGEFMPEGGPSTPEALKCAACGCHRSFHRKDGDTDVNADNSYHHHHHGASHLPLLLPPPHPQSHPYNQQKPFPFGFPSSPPSRAVPLSSAVMAFGGNTCGSGGTTTESSSEERINAGAPTPAIALRKRFRTKFTAEQKEKMLAFAERVGWRIQKQEEAVVEQFCAEVGVRR